VSTIEPIRKHITVAAPQERAFRVFTQNMTAWWPKEHHLSRTSDLKQIGLEERVGGRWFEICEDGSECNWGKVLAWDPPRRVVLAWQINGAWTYDPDFVTELEVTFTVEGPKQTRVELEHRNLERFGADAATIRESLAKGWELPLPGYAKLAEQ
jgi:uncharacterized protein YndB with AHSA1/START domain